MGGLRPLQGAAGVGREDLEAVLFRVSHGCLLGPYLGCPLILPMRGMAWRFTDWLRY